MGQRDRPPCPPIVKLSSGRAGHLLAWEQHEADGSWWAWVSWVQETSRGYRHLIAEVRADGVEPAEPLDVYRAVPRRVLGRDGQIRPWPARS